MTTARGFRIEPQGLLAGSIYPSFMAGFPSDRRRDYVLQADDVAAYFSYDDIAKVHAALGAWLTETSETDEEDPHAVEADKALPRRPVGSRAVVTGDSAEWNHEFQTGTEVKILRDDVDIDGSYRVEIFDETDDTRAWVAARDLADVPEDVKPRFAVGDRVRVVANGWRGTHYPRPIGHSTPIGKEGEILAVRTVDADRFGVLYHTSASKLWLSEVDLEPVNKVTPSPVAPAPKPAPAVSDPKPGDRVAARKSSDMYGLTAGDVYTVRRVELTLGGLPLLWLEGRDRPAMAHRFVRA